MQDPGYGKLQVGIYVAAVQDIIDRMKQRLHRSLTEGDNSSDLAGGDNDKADRESRWVPEGEGRKQGGLVTVRRCRKKRRKDSRWFKAGCYMQTQK